MQHQGQLVKAQFIRQDVKSREVVYHNKQKVCPSRLSSTDYNFGFYSRNPWNTLSFVFGDRLNSCALSRTEEAPYPHLSIVNLFEVLMAQSIN